MQSIELTCHPSTPCELIRRFGVRAYRMGGELSLEYSIEGGVGDVCVPSPRLPARAEGLWQHTCFEAFLKGHPLVGYYEFNFAPSTEWAIYRFQAYREGMVVAENTRPPKIALRRNAHRLELDALVDLNDLPPLPESADLRLALSAVIEEDGGRFSYWALVHPVDKPDFHHPKSFAFRLDRTEMA